MNDPSPARQIVVVLTASSWNEPKRLRRQLAEVLSQDIEVVYVTLPYGMCKPRKNTDRVDARVRVLTLAGPPVPLRLLARLPALQAVYERMLAWRMQRRLRGIGHICAVFCFTPYHPGLLACFSGVPVIYVANDDHASMAGSEAAAASIARDEARTIARSHRVVSVSEVIARKLALYGKPVHVMYPGHSCEVLPLQRFTDNGRLARSVCFFGYIDWRIDFELLSFLLDKDWHVALVGPVVGTARQVSELQTRFQGRFNVQPAIPAEQAPELLARYQVLIAPYRFRSAEQAEVVELLNKTFIYFSALRPVVTTWMPNLKLVEPGLIYRATTHEEFLSHCLRAIEEDSPVHAARRLSIAQQNTWNARRLTLRALIDGTAPVLADVAS